MVALQTAAMLLAVSAGGDTVLLDFQAQWCGPCRAMSPVVDQLVASGYPVRKVDFDQERALAARHGVKVLPTFVLVVGGSEAGRIIGPATRGELEGLFAKAGVNAGAAAGSASRRKDPFARHAEAASAALPSRRFGGRADDVQIVPVRGPASSSTRFAIDQRAADGGSIADRLIGATVRLSIEDPDGTSYGSGTIIDARDGEALIATCAHVFRDSHGKGKISADMFGPSAPRKLPGQLISYDLKRDVGLLSIRPGVPVTPCRVAPEGYALQQGQQVLSCGCGHGRDATVERGTILGVDKFVGEPNVQVTGQPVQGRSGGGLFTPEGLLIGVCNAADPTDDAGLYAAVGAVHGQLDASKLSFVYRVPADSTTSAAPAVATRPAARDEGARPVADSARDSAAQALTTGERATLSEIDRRGQDAEVICIVRSSSDPHGKSEIFVLDRASPAFRELMSSARTEQDGRRLTSLELPREPAEKASPPLRAANSSAQATRHY